MAKKKKPKSQYQFLKNYLRQASMRWPPKSEARKRAAVKVLVGKFKNGNDKYLTQFICAECERQGINITHEEDFTQMDHIIPCREPADGEWDGNWTKLINNMLCPTEGYQCLCKPHHEEKTTAENLNRTFSKKKK